MLEDEPVSTFTLQYFGIQVGEQSRLLAAVPTDRTATRDHKDVMSVFRCIHDTCGAHRAFQFKFTFDDAADVIYCLSSTVDEVDFQCGKIFKVEEEGMMPFEFVFYKVASVLVGVLGTVYPRDAYPGIRQVFEEGSLSLGKGESRKEGPQKGPT